MHLYWEFKEESLRLQVLCHNSVTSVSAENKLKEISPQLEEKVSKELTERNQTLRNELKMFFDTQENKEILEEMARAIRQKLGKCVPRRTRPYNQSPT